MSLILLITPDPETSSIFKIMLELKGHVVERVIDYESFSNKKYDLCIVDMPIWNEEEINNSWKCIENSKKRDIPSVLLLPRGHTKAPSQINATATFVRPYELIALIEELESLIYAQNVLDIS